LQSSLTSSLDPDELGSLLLDLPPFRRLKKDLRVVDQFRREPSLPSASTPRLRFIRSSWSTCGQFLGSLVCQEDVSRATSFLLFHPDIHNIEFIWSATSCASPPPRLSIFSNYSFLVHLPVNWDDRNLLAHAMASDFTVAWQYEFRNRTKGTLGRFLN
jgi:hypothetical protein